MTPTELLALLAFLEEELPLARQDVLSRLAKAVQLAAGSFAQQAVIANLKQSGQWQAASAAQRGQKKRKKGIKDEHF